MAQLHSEEEIQGEFAYIKLGVRNLKGNKSWPADTLYRT